MKSLASDLLQKVPRSRTQTRLNLLTYDNLISWKSTRDLSQAKLREAVNGLDVRQPRSESSLSSFIRTIDQSLTDNTRKKGVPSKVLVISDGAPKREILDYLNTLAKEGSPHTVTIVMTNGKVKDVGDLVVQPNLRILTGNFVDDPDKISNYINPGKMFYRTFLCYHCRKTIFKESLLTKSMVMREN